MVKISFSEWKTSQKNGWKMNPREFFRTRTTKRAGNMTMRPFRDNEGSRGDQEVCNSSKQKCVKNIFKTGGYNMQIENVHQVLSTLNNSNTLNTHTHINTHTPHTTHTNTHTYHIPHTHTYTHTPHTTHTPHIYTHTHTHTHAHTHTQAHTHIHTHKHTHTHTHTHKHTHTHTQSHLVKELFYSWEHAPRTL